MEYSEDDFLPLSGIQHFSFCRRQWALIHIEQQWNENYLTADGRAKHEHAHSGPAREKRGDTILIREMPVSSRKLGLSGICDVVEFKSSKSGVPIFGTPGKWLPCPVEYKRGKPKENPADRLQLCCEAMCLEEMLVCPPIEKAYLFYFELNHRVEIILDDELRSLVAAMSEEMHEYYRRGYTPRVRKNNSCKACSLKNICVPEAYKNASDYIKRRLEESVP